MQQSVGKATIEKRLYEEGWEVHVLGLWGLTRQRHGQCLVPFTRCKCLLLISTAAKPPPGPAGAQDLDTNWVGGRWVQKRLQWWCKGYACLLREHWCHAEPPVLWLEGSGAAGWAQSVRGAGSWQVLVCSRTCHLAPNVWEICSHWTPFLGFALRGFSSNQDQGLLIHLHSS